MTDVKFELVNPLRDSVAHLNADLALYQSTYNLSSDECWSQGYCAECNADRQLFVLAYVADGMTLWTRCMSCGSPVIEHKGEIFPAPLPFVVPAGLDQPSLSLWREARSCYSMSAYTGAVMLCRKLLFHMAVATGLPAKDAKNRAPGFEECLNHLEAKGFTTSQMRPWVDRLRDIGNEANHEVPAITRTSALDVGAFTELLLRHVFELPLKIAPIEGG